MIRSRYPPGPSGASPEPAMTKLFTSGASPVAAGTVYENAWKEGSTGGSTSGQTFERATGFSSSLKMPQRSRVPT